MFTKSLPNPLRAILFSGLLLFSMIASTQIREPISYAAIVPSERPGPPNLISSRCSLYEAPDVPAPLNTYYIDASQGNDSNSGVSLQTAWRSLTKANSVAKAGDLFLLRGTFRDQWISPADSGSAMHKIVYRALPDHKAVLDGGLYGGAVDLIGKSHIVIDGLEIVNTDQSVRVAYDSHYNWLRNLYIHDATGTAVKFRYGAHHNRLEDSVITHVGTAYDNDADAINLLNDADNNIIVRNFVGHSSHAAYNDDIQGDSTGHNENNIVAQNIFDNPWASNVILAGRSKSGTVECNIMRNATRSSSVNYPRMGLQLDGDDNVIRFNYIYDNLNQGILIEGRVFAGSQEMFAENNHIYHNTITGNGTAGIFLATQGSAGLIRGNLIENNLLWNNRGYDGANGFRYDLVSDNYTAGSTWVAGSSNDNIFRSNNVSSDDIVRFFMSVSPGGTANLALNTPGSAMSAFPLWTGNTSVDPLFSTIGTNQFAISSTSPMVDAGRLIEGVSFKGSGPDIGAFESTGDGELADAVELEGDVASGIKGDGLMRLDDIELVRRIAVGSWVPDLAKNEFQRADSSPLATKGDGVITAADVVQAKRFVASLDNPGPVGGPRNSEQQ